MHATRRMCKRHYPSIKWHFRNFYFILFLINAYYLLGVSVLLCRPTLINDVLRKLLKYKLLHHDSSNNCESLFLCFALHCITLNIYSLNFVQHNKEHPCVLFCQKMSIASTACRELTRNFQLVRYKKQRKHTPKKKNNHTYKIIFTWFGNLSMSMELQGFHYYQGKNTKCGSIMFQSLKHDNKTNPNHQNCVFYIMCTRFTMG